MGNTLTRVDSVEAHVDDIMRNLPEPRVICEHAGSGNALFATLFDRLEEAKATVITNGGAAALAKFMELVFKSNELGLAYCNYTFGKRMIQHKVVYGQVRQLHTEIDGLFQSLGIQATGVTWDALVRTANEELVAILRRKVESETVLQEIYAKRPKLRKSDLSQLQQAQDSSDGKQWSDTAKTLMTKLLHWSKSAAHADDVCDDSVSADAGKDESSLLVHRTQLCVLGSTGTGKSSLVRSLVEMKPSIADANETPSDAQPFALSFYSKTQPSRRYEATCWDLGAEATHALFFTKKTTFVVCVDLQAYDAKRQSDVDTEIQPYVLAEVFHWVQSILSRQPEAEIVFFGTKGDLVDAERAEIVRDDLNRRTKLWAQSFVDVVPVSSAFQVRKSLRDLTDRGLVVVNVADHESLKAARLAVEDIIDKNKDLCQPMTILHSRFLDAIRTRSRDAAALPLKDRLDRVIIPASLMRNLARQVKDLPAEKCKDILLALRDVQEVLWFDDGIDPSDQLILLDPSVIDRQALQQLLFPDDDDDDLLMEEESISTAIKVLCLHGVKWDEVCEQKWQRLLKVVEDKLDFVPDSKLLQAGLAKCAQLWIEARTHDPLKPLINVPLEFIRDGPESVDLYVKDVKNAKDQDLVYRCKICIVGPGLGGKTSMIKSMSTGTPQLVDERDRTIGIDLFPINFSHASKACNGAIVTKNYEVTFWDFAGQDVYQVAHTLFFSERNLYLLCIDLDKYVEQLNDNTGGQWMKDERIQRYLQDRVFRWTRLIFARQPDAEVVVIGTKKDLVAPDQVKRVFDNFSVHLEDWIDKYVSELDSEQKAVVKESLLFLRAGDRYSVTVTTPEGVSDAFDTIKQLVLSKPSRSIAMPPMYTRVLQEIRAMRLHVADANDERDLIEKTVVVARKLIADLVAAIDDLTAIDCKTILTTFHNLGDILWYDQESKDQLKEFVILKPSLALDVVREVINHNYPNLDDPRFKELDQSGALAHDFLMEMPLWKALGDLRADLVLFFKNLLWLFHLAYPAGSNEMVASSDLIVPTYWRSKRQSDKDNNKARLLQSQKTLLETEQVSDASSATWQYVVPVEIAKTVFDQFIVASHSKQFERRATVDSVQAFIRRNFAARIVHKEGSITQDEIRIEVVAATEEICWKRLRFFAMAMERVIDSYPGLTFHRELVYEEDGKDRPVSVEQVVREIAEVQELGLSRSSEPRRLPPSLRWYTEKAWKNPEVLSRIEAHERLESLDHTTHVVKNLLETSGNQERFPSVWTLDYNADDSLVRLRLFSEVSGVCYHPPIRIKLLPEFLAKYGEWIRVGLSIFSMFVSRDLVKDIIEKAFELSDGRISQAIKDARVVHDFTGQLNLKTSGASSTQISIQTSTELLRALLLAHDDSFTMQRLPQLANLVCAAQPDGRYLWANNEEFNLMKEKIVGLRIKELQPDQVAVAVTVAIKSIYELPRSDWNRVRCEWGLTSSLHSAQMHGETPVHKIANARPEWNNAAISSVMPSLDALNDYELKIDVQQKSRFMSRLFNKKFVTISSGTLSLKGLIPTFLDKPRVELPVRVMLGATSSMYVECSITLEVTTTDPQARWK